MVAMISSPKRKSNAITEVFREGDALFLRSQRGILRLMPCTDSVVRVSYTECDTFSTENSLGIVHRDPFPEWTYSLSSDQILLQLPKLSAYSIRSTGSIIWRDSDGNLLLRERDHDSHQLY